MMLLFVGHGGLSIVSLTQHWSIIGSPPLENCKCACIWIYGPKERHRQYRILSRFMSRIVLHVNFNKDMHSLIIIRNIYCCNFAEYFSWCCSTFGNVVHVLNFYIFNQMSTRRYFRSTNTVRFAKCFWPILIKLLYLNDKMMIYIS